MASQGRVPSPAPCSPTRCPRRRVMNYWSPFSALFRGAVKATARGLVRHGWSSNTCNVVRHGSGGTWTPPQSVTWTFRRCYVCRFSWYIYACLNTHTHARLNTWSWWKLCVAAVSCLNRRLSWGGIVRVTHSQRAQAKVPPGYACLLLWREGEEEEEERDPN